MNKILLVVDLQEAFRHEPEYTKCRRFIKEHKNDYVRIIRTVFANPKGYRETNKNYERYLGFTEESMTPDEIRKSIMEPDTIVKYGYGIPGNLKDMNSSGYLPTDVSYDVIGCDTDACVMAVCFELFDNGYDFHVLTDYCYTTGGWTVQEAAVKLMKRNFGKAVI